MVGRQRKATSLFLRHTTSAFKICLEHLQRLLSPSQHLAFQCLESHHPAPVPRSPHMDSNRATKEIEFGIDYLCVCSLHS